MDISQYVFQALLTLHLVGLALGLGGAALADFTFFRLIGMGDRITPADVSWMRSFSMVVWLGLGILFTSGIGLFSFNPEQYINMSGFVAKLVFVAILTVNGIFLNFYVNARVTTFNFSSTYNLHNAAWRARKLSFAFGAIGATTWYAAVIAAMFKSLLKVP